MHNFSMLSFALLLSWLLAISVAQIEKGIDAKDFGDVCECSPDCSPQEDIDCKNSRFAPREDCLCCKVCLRLQGDLCSAQKPCDKELGLSCSSKGICQASSTCKVDDDCTEDLFCVKDTCTDPCPLLQPCHGALKGGICVTRKHQPKCECPKGSFDEAGVCTVQSGTDASGKPGGKLGSKLAMKPGHIQIKSATQNSTVVFVPSTLGGILHYKESRSDIEASKITVAVGEQETMIKHLNPSTKYILKWVGNDGSSAKSEIKTEDGCRHNGVSYPVGAKWHEGCQTACSCHLGGVSECRPRCIFVAGAIKDDQCQEQRSPSDPECCVEYNCKKGDNSVLESSSSKADGAGSSVIREPKLIVTSRTHNSVTVAWDDFRADDPSSSYVTEYREVPVQSIEIPWMKRETPRGQPPPTMTIASLKPNTLYEVRVGIYSNVKERRLNAATETITVRTEPGCVYGNTSFPVGEFFQGCEERCSCAKDGSVKCSERCSIPYFRRYSFANDPLCTEESADGDDCCVLVLCAHGDNISGVEGDYDQCANTVCGKNAECVSWPTLTEASSGIHDSTQPGSCRCIDGFSGDPADLETGCIPDPALKNEANSCKFKSNYYSPGDVFYDGCSYACTCNKKLEIECQPRCKYSKSDEMESKVSCTFTPDPNDTCCQIRNCNSTSDLDSESMQAPSLTFDGCLYRNKTYTKDEEFGFGCDSKCLCMGFGDVSCSPRCPPTKEVTKKEGLICETLLDPEDECCNVTLCDTVVPEVMKAGVAETILDAIELNSSSTVETTTVILEEMMNETQEVTSLSPLDEVMIKTEEPIISDEEETTTTLPSEEVMEETLVPKKRLRFEDPLLSMIEIDEVQPVDSSNVKFKVHVGQEILQQFLSSDSESIVVSYSPDAHQWTNKTVNVQDVDIQDMYFLTFVVPDLEANDAYHFKVYYSNLSSPIKKVSFKSAAIMTGVIESRAVHDDVSCLFKGQSYKPGETFYEGCKQFCQCNDDLKVNCGLIECPKYFGLNILDPECLEWEDDPDYVATPPKCCGLKPKCALHMDQLSCTHMGHNFKHLDYITKEMVGCDQRCQCIRGSLECEDLCSPVQATPPFNLPCPPIQIRLITMPTFPCCREWQCVNTSNADILHPLPLPPGIFPNGNNKQINFPGPPAPPPGITKPMILDLAEDFVTFIFAIPSTFVGLPGGLYLRFTENVVSNPNPLNWESEVIHEDGVTLDQSQWQYTKRGLKPRTNYSMQVSLSSHLAKAEINSPNFVVSTLADETELQSLEIHPGLSVKDLRSTSAVVAWREFSDDEIKYINAVQVRYWSKNKQIPEKSPLLHVEANAITLKELKPGTEYTVDLVILPHHNSPMEITSEGNLTFKTASSEEATDILPRLEFDAELSVNDIQNTSAKVSWKDFTDAELQYIDGIRVRFWSRKKRFPQEGPMLHREADNMILRDLDPDTKYTVDLFFIPHLGLSTAITNTKNITFNTLPKPKDMYAFNISINAGEIDEKGVQVLYSGVTEPEGKYVNVYRVVYTSDGDSQDSQKFKVPKNQKDRFVLLTNLKPGVTYEVWLEAYLTNGSKKKSNVISVTTDFDGVDSSAINEIAESKKLKQDENGNYYSAFVAVAILVAIACLIIIGLLFVLMRRTSHAKAHINSPKGTSAYDNPSYKTSENPNYAMELNGMKNTTNGGSQSAEDPC